MKKANLLKLLLLLCMPVISFAQTASDILEHAVRIDKTNQLRLKFDNSILMYQSVAKEPGSYVTLDDSFYFLSPDKTPVYIQTVNPLNFSVTSSVSYTADELSAAEEKAFTTLIAFLKAPGAQPPKAAGAAALGPPVVVVQDFDGINRALDELKKTLVNGNKKLIADQFTLLKSVSFDRLTAASQTMADVGKFYDDLAAQYKIYQVSADNIKDAIAKYTEPVPPIHDSVLAKDLFNRKLDEINATITTQLKWLSNLAVAKKMLQDAMNNATNLDGSLMTKLDEVINKSGKIANQTITVNQDGLKLGADNDIVAQDKKEIFKRVIKFRKFSHFVFEVAAGLAFANIDFPKFGTTTDATGNTVVADAGKDSFRKFNLTAMFNWNYYIPNSPIHPFFQLGVGASSQYPVLFSGIGLRFNSDGSSHFAISGGFASTWVKTLNKLKIGDAVAGSADIDKDVTYEFHFPLKPYLGIQYNF